MGTNRGSGIVLSIFMESAFPLHAFPLVLRRIGAPVNPSLDILCRVNIPVEFGRQELKVEGEKRISKKHVSVLWDGSVLLICSLGRNSCWIKREPGISLTFARQEVTRMLKGDTLFMIPGHDYAYQFHLYTVPQVAGKRQREIVESPRKKMKCTPTGTLHDSSIEKIMNIMFCSYDIACSALRQSSGNEAMAIERICTTNTSSNNSQDTKQSEHASGRCFYPNYIPFCANKNGAKRITDIVSGNIKKAILCSYLIDVEWLLGQLPILLRIPTILSHGQKGPLYSPARLPGNIRVLAPKMEIPFGCNHGKLFVLYYEEKVRVCVSTANLLEMDYYRKAQGVWYQDFYWKKYDPSGGLPEKSDFENSLCDYLERQGVPGGGDIGNFDFSSANVSLITSVPGIHKDGTLYSYGHMKLRKLLSETVTNKSVRLLSQFSSVGSLTQSWVEGEFKHSVMGCLTNEELSRIPLHMLWPSDGFVRSSIDGEQAGGSLCLGRKNMKSFLYKYFHQYQSQEDRKIIPPHIKTYLSMAQGQRSSLEWILLTSSNLSKAAWGTLQKGETQLMIRHFEIGVLFLPQATNSFTIGDISDEKSGNVTFYLPYKCNSIPPFKEQESIPSEKPWVWDLN